MSWHQITYVSIGLIMTATSVAGIASWVASPVRPPGTHHWSALVWPVYGALLSVIAAFSIHFGLFALGMVASLLSPNVYQLWVARVLGSEEYHRQARSVLERGGRKGYFLATVGTLVIRSAPGAVLALGLPSENPFAWLGMGILASAAGTLASAYRIQRVALTPPRGASSVEGGA